MCRFLATGGATDGKYALWEAVVPPGGGPPPHVHSREEEGFFGLDGGVTAHVGEERVVETAGMYATMPVGTPDGLKNDGDRPAEVQPSAAPAGLGQMFFEVGVPPAEGATTAEGRLKSALQFGATDFVSSRGDAAVQEVQALTGGGAEAVLGCVGSGESM